MRAGWLVLVLVCACSPEIAPGAYDCGPNGLCPSGTVCNPADGTCVLASTTQPLDCAAITSDDTPATATAIAGLTCVSPPSNTTDCFIHTDAIDWFQFDVPGDCTAVKVVARVTFPLAFENIALDFTDGATVDMAVDTKCPGAGSDAADVSRCFERTLTPGRHYAIAARADGTGNCNGNCAFNSYSLSVQLATP